MEFEISYTNKEVTPWGGMVFLKRMMVHRPLTPFKNLQLPIHTF